MKQSLKKLFCMFTAAALTAGALSLTACGGSSFRPVSPDQAEHVESNGGFVVSTDEYYYFINGVESNQSDNTYGEVVKGALMRIKKSDVAAKKNEAETVIPSLMVTGDPATAAGICIYGGRIYYATPNNIKNTDGGINRDRLNFRSVKTDGSDVKDIFALDNGSVEYRFVEIDGTVYVLYIDGTTIHSYNTKNGTDTVLAENAGNPTFHNTDKEDPYVYYTMSVTDGLDRESGQISYSYNQIYRVRADVTEETAGHTYTWDEDYLKEHDDKAPYVNLGEIVLDGIGAIDQKVAITQFNHDVTEENVSQLPRIGYTYTMQEYSNEGIYFVRKLYRNDSSLGTSGELYYLPISAIGKGKSIANNAAKPASDGVLDVVASATNTSNASSSAMFYLENGQHKYLYVSDGYIYRVDVKTDGSGAPEDTVEIAYGAANATFVLRDDTSSQEYKYLYYSVTNGNGRSVHRAVYNGEKRDYGNLQFGDEDQALWSAVKLLDVQHASSWYDYEILGGTLFYANSESFGSNTYNYIYTVDLTNPNGTLMNNAEIKAFNEKYEEVTDTEDGYFGEVKKNVSENAATALRYYFYTGSKTQFEENIKYSVDTCGHKEEYLYTVKEKDAFNAFAAGTVKDS
ncbi:MAG: hypothetical protein K2H43_04775, partial [Clostridia bacterium]|nr:hypothetical protein [Clostridia bacterium]